MKFFTAFIAAVVTAAAIMLYIGAQPVPTVSAVSSVVINSDTGEILYENNAYEIRAMASTTKIMTALLTLEAGDLDRRFTADSMAIRVEGTSMGLREGDIVTRRALVYGMLLPSGNDAANAAAVSVSGSISEFAKLMNERAAEIGMKNTNFVNPSGLDADGHYTTAYDMALLTKEALKNEEFRAICCLETATLEYGNPPYSRTLTNSNKLLYMYDGCIGVKTGFTDNARRCLVSAAEHEGMEIIAVTLNAPDDWSDHAKMLDYGFSCIAPYNVGLRAFSVPVIGGETDNISVKPSEECIIGLSESEKNDIKVKYYLPEFVYAGIEKGEPIGRAEIYCKDELIECVTLEAAGDCTISDEKTENIFESFLSWLF